MENIAGFISVGLLVIINIAIAFNAYGKLSQQVADLCRRVGKLEEKIFNGHK